MRRVTSKKKINRTRKVFRCSIVGHLKKKNRSAPDPEERIEPKRAMAGLPGFPAVVGFTFFYYHFCRRGRGRIL